MYVFRLPEAMVPSPPDSPERRIKRRRKFPSSETTLRDHSTKGYPTSLSATPPISISELTPLKAVNHSAVLSGKSLEQTSTKCYNKSGDCDIRKVDERTGLTVKKNHINPPIFEELIRRIEKESIREFPKNVVTVFKHSGTPRMETRSSARLTGKPLESHAPETKSLNLGIPYSKSKKMTNGSRRREMEESRSTRSCDRIRYATNKPSMLKKIYRQRLRSRTKKQPLSRELRNLADTLEYAKIDTVPVIYEVWSNGKSVTGDFPPKKGREQDNSTESKALDESVTSFIEDTRGREKKRWLTKGLYAGQEDCQTWYESPTNKKSSKTRSSTFPKPNKVLPFPMWYGKRLIEIGRDFKLPFDVCSPLPPGQPKPDEWRKATRNRFIGEAGALWKVSKFLESASSKCVCKPTTGCDENCQNRIMFYECDDKNCASGPDRCTNRPFAALQERRKAGGKYRVGVEVIKTADRGYGIRSNRCFEPHQIIVEYNGEIITEEECDRRMHEIYKDNDCHYLMSFDQSMIIDATKGSIARFINHSCKPNCRMVKWIVGGSPRMALFAGDEPIMTGDELTYDYNFDPFSTKNIQECRCGSENCRGVLGPRPKDTKSVKEKEVLKDTSKTAKVSGKRKIKDFNETNNPGDLPARKRRKLGDVVITNETSLLPRMNIVQRGDRPLKENGSSKSFSLKPLLNPTEQITAKTRRSKALFLVTTAEEKTTVSSRRLSRAAATSKPSVGCYRILRSTKKPLIMRGRNTKRDRTEISRSSSFRKKL